MERKQHKGLTITFWIIATILGIHYFFIYLPHGLKNNTLNFPSLLGSLIIPIGILSVIWLIKRNAEKKINSSDVMPNIPISNTSNSEVLDINNRLMDFGKSFSEEQKALIIWFLVKIANSDGEVNEREEQQLSQIMYLIDYDASRDESQKMASQVSQYTISKIKGILDMLDNSLKEWFVTCAFSLIVCDGIINNEEVDSSIYYASMFGFSVEEHDEIIKKTIALSQNSGRR